MHGRGCSMVCSIGGKHQHALLWKRNIHLAHIERFVSAQVVVDRGVLVQAFKRIASRGAIVRGQLAQTLPGEQIPARIARPIQRCMVFILQKRLPRCWAVCAPYCRLRQSGWWIGTGYQSPGQRLKTAYPALGRYGAQAGKLPGFQTRFPSWRHTSRTRCAHRCGFPAEDSVARLHRHSRQRPPAGGHRIAAGILRGSSFGACPAGNESFSAGKSCLLACHIIRSFGGFCVYHTKTFT